jgi:hypothetical protein
MQAAIVRPNSRFIMFLPSEVDRDGRKKFRSEQEYPNRKKRAAGADDRCPNVVSLRIVHISRAWAEEADERIPKDGSFGSKRAMCSAE